MESTALLNAATRDILAERDRQISAEGWSPEHDDAHKDGEMSAAAATYALHDIFDGFFGRWLHTMWPWDIAWWKPADRRRNLVKAGALILAEIERFDRVESRAHERNARNKAVA